MKKILIIQTAFIGDVILATSLLEKLHSHFPNASIHILVRNGNESLFDEHPFISKVWVWNKSKQKTKNLFRLLKEIRKEKFDDCINIQRFLSSGILCAFSKSKNKIGFKKNPLSIFFNQRIEHEIGNGLHEIERNHLLIEKLTDKNHVLPKLYPQNKHFEKINHLIEDKKYICLAPASVWFTKQLPFEKWVEIARKNTDLDFLYFIGGKNDKDLIDKIIESSNVKNAFNLAGSLSFLESAALMKNAEMNYVNDSAPLHLTSAVNAPVTAYFCSTIPEFGFTPLSENSTIIQTLENLSCRPCGLHGKKTCPKNHFKCGNQIIIS